MTNQAIARILARMADLLEIENDNPFKVRAYRRAAEQIEGLTENLASLVERGDLESLPGIGKGLAAKITEMVTTGACAEYEALRVRVPEGLPELLSLPGLGPRRVAQLWKERGIASLVDLEAAAQAGTLRNLPGISERTEANLLAAIEQYRRRTARWPIGRALPYAESLVSQLLATGAFERIEIAGSLRRWRDTVGDIDLVAVARDPQAALGAFCGLREAEAVLERDDRFARLRAEEGRVVELRLAPPEQWGAVLLQQTGSAAHLARLQELARARGWRLDDFGVAPDREREAPIAVAEEADLYAALGLPPIPPELREDRGEIEAALSGRLPVPIAPSDYRGVLHAHTNWSDGAASIAAMVEAARALGHEYLAITDHSRALTVARGLDEERLRRQMAEIDALNATRPGILVLKGIECDIRADGTLDLDPALLAELDLVIGSIHSHFRQDVTTMTRRIVAAMESGVVDLIAHPTGRLLGVRDPYAVDVDRLLDAAAATGVALEINAAPERLDLDDDLARRAAERGIPIAINPDAHTPAALGLLRYGIGQARRAWLTPEQVLNAWPAERLCAWLQRRRGR